MVYATCRAGETVIVQRNAHKSIFHAIELTGARPVFVSPDWDACTKTAGVVTVEQISRGASSPIRRRRRSFLHIRRIME